MTEQEWLASSDPESLLAEHTAPSKRKARLLACASCHSIWNVLADDRCRRVVEVVENVVDGLVNELVLPDEHRIASEGRGSFLIHKVHAAIYTAQAMPEHLKDVLNCCASSTKQPAAEKTAQSRLLRDIFGNPFRPVSFDPEWRTSTRSEERR